MIKKIIDFKIKFANTVIGFSVPRDAFIPKILRDFQCNDEEKADVEYEVRLIKTPLMLMEDPIAFYNGIKVFPYKQGQLRVYSQLIAEDGCQVACYLGEKQKNILYYPDSMWNFYAEELNLLHLIGIEHLLLKKNAFLLHSSFVELNGRAILFSGPSGIGKSTQAVLWEQCLGAKIINGDRCIVKKEEELFYGCGSPWCGTSGIHLNKMMPIQGILILNQAENNTIRRLKSEAFSHIHRQTIINGWDAQFVEKMSDMIVDLLKHVPVYELSCRPDEEAVQLAYKTLFEGGI